jgi:branched-chain amino acid transport system substrate-binding protein
MSKRRLVRAAAVVAGLALAVAACGDDDDVTSTTAATGDSETTDAASDGEVTEVSFAFVGPLTGDSANLGIYSRNGARVAIEQFNEEHPDFNITLEEFDTQGDPAQAPTVLDDYISDESIIGVIGPTFSGETRAVLPTLEEEGLVMISPSATNVELPDIVPGGSVFHRVLPDDAAQAAGVAQYLTTELQPASIAIVHDNSDYGKGLAEEQLVPLLEGIEIVASEVIDPDAQDYSSAVNAVRDSGAEAIFFGGYYEQGGRLRRQLVDAGVDATFISGDGSLDVGFVDAAGDAAAGSLLSCPCFFASEAAEGPIGEFATVYEEIHNSAPGTYSTEGYDTANIFLSGVLEGNTDRASMLEYVEGVTAVEDAISKELVFAENGNIESQGIFIFRVDEEGGIVLEVATEDL